MDISVVSSALPGTLEFNRLARQRGSSVSIPTFKSEDPEDLARVLAAVLANPARPQTSAYIHEYYSAPRHCEVIVEALSRALAAVEKVPLKRAA
jgi:hypothetical protein